MTSTVPPGRASLHRYPGTSCLATISLSLRDKSHSPIEAPHIYLSAYGVNPEQPFGPPGTSCLATIVLSLRDLEFGHFLVRVPSARRANRKQPRASVLGTTRTRKSP